MEIFRTQLITLTISNKQEILQFQRWCTIRVASVLETISTTRKIQGNLVIFKNSKCRDAEM